MRWRDLDPLGHVSAAVFLSYLEEGRNAWLRSVLGEGFRPEEYVFARIEVDYRAEIPIGTAYVRSEHAIESLGRSSVVCGERLRGPDGQPVAEAKAVLVMWDPQQHRSRRISDVERDRLAAIDPG